MSEDPKSHYFVKVIKENSPDRVYTGNMVFGTHRILTNMVFDTYTGSVAVTHSACDTCRSKVYNPDLSTAASSTG